MLAIVIGAIALVASFVEFVLMAFRGGVLVILCGLIPLAAAFSNIPTGERWLRRIAGWIVALALYKLAAAFCYAAAFRLSAGTDVIAVMDGLALLVVSVVALPVLLRLTLPAAEHFTLHRGAAASTRTALGAMPTGAITLAAAGAAAGAAGATGAEQRLTSSATRGASAGPSGAGATDGEGSSRGGTSPDGARGSSGAPVPGPSDSSGAGGTKGSDGAGGAPSGRASPTGGEGSPGGRIARSTASSFAVPGTAGSPDRDDLGADGGSDRPSGAPEAGAPPDPGGIQGAGGAYESPGQAASGAGGAPGRSQSGRVDPPQASSGEDPNGADESWSGD
jgi:hypothetical protein